MSYVQISEADFGASMIAAGFSPVLDEPGSITMEIVYERKLQGKLLSIRVFSTIIPDKGGRACGRDAIRVCVWHIEANKPIKTMTRVHRSGDPAKKALARMREAWVFAAATPLCPRCESPMVERQPKYKLKVEEDLSKLSTDFTFWGCVKFPFCRGTREKKNDKQKTG